MKHLLPFIFVLTCLFVKAQQTDIRAIQNTLDQQVHKWNQGDPEGFMQGYWKSDSLIFVGKNGVTHGWQQTLDNYKKGYPGPASMGKLDFSMLNFKKLSPEYYFVTGHWHLTRKSGELQGWFSLLFKKIDNTWLIIADHSS